MLGKRIIPCLDVDQGRVVKGKHFQNLQDAGDPIALAKYYDDQGADELVFLDITASVDKRGILMDLVSRTAEQLFIPFTVGGGISDVQTISDLLCAGADKVSINTAAVYNPNLIKQASDRFGSQCIVVAMDVKKMIHPIQQASIHPEFSLSQDSVWEVYTHGGRKRTGMDAVKWGLYMQSQGAGEVLLTSMDQDGTRSGYDLALYQAFSKSLQIPVISSGGAGSLQDIVEVLAHCEAALLASILHFKTFSIEQIKQACLTQGIFIRPF